MPLPDGNLTYEEWLIVPGARPGERLAVAPTANDYYRLIGATRSFENGFINSGQYGSIGSVSIDPMSGVIYLAANPEYFAPAPVELNDVLTGQQQYGVDTSGNLTPLFAPPPPQPPPYMDLGGYQEPPMALPPTVIFTATPASIGTGQYNLRAPVAGQPVGSIPGYNELPIQISGPGGMGYSSGYVNSMTAGEIAAGLGMVGCNLITDPVKRAGCIAALALLANATNMPNGGQTMMNGGGMAATGLATCPPGQVSMMGKCLNFPAMLPGGAPFVTSSMGIFGVPSAAPSLGTQMVLKCARGLVLGKDNRCYAKGSIPRNARKWAPEPRPLVSRSDVKALSRIKSIRGRVKKAASSAGLSCATKGSRAGKPARKR